MPYRKRKIAARLSAAEVMPPLYHKLPGSEFDPNKSECLQWIAEEPDLLLWLFDTLRDKGLIEFDRATRQWHGRKRASEPKRDGLE